MVYNAGLGSSWQRCNTIAACGFAACGLRIEIVIYDESDVVVK